MTTSFPATSTTAIFVKHLRIDYYATPDCLNFFTQIVAAWTSSAYPISMIPGILSLLPRQGFPRCLETCCCPYHRENRTFGDPVHLVHFVTRVGSISIRSPEFSRFRRLRRGSVLSRSIGSASDRVRFERRLAPLTSVRFVFVHRDYPFEGLICPEIQPMFAWSGRSG